MKLVNNALVWDIRVPEELKKYYMDLKEIGLKKKNTYFYKLTLDQATIVMAFLSDAYNVPPPILIVNDKISKEYCCSKRNHIWSNYKYNSYAY